VEVKTMVYQATNLKNDKIYIGSTTVGLKKTKFFHKSCADRGESRPIYMAIKKHGFYNFIYNAIGEFQSKSAAYEFKEACIIELNAMNPKYGYNCTTGRLDKFKMNKETREKISEIQTGKTMPESFVKFMKERVSPLIGYKHTQEAKKNMRLGQLNSDFVKTDEMKKRQSETMKKRWKEPDVIEKMKNRKRGKVTEETRKKLSIANSGKNNAMYGVKGKDHHLYGTTISKKQINLMQKGQEKYREKRRKEALARTEKKCNKCKEIKPLDMFYKSKKNLDGLDYHCRDCEKLRKKKYYGKKK
tara:strand:+ start:797 stop:1699 length:903 start_codon:yes stop_codon:yes gene_type:complete